MKQFIASNFYFGCWNLFFILLKDLNKGNIDDEEFGIEDIRIKHNTFTFSYLTRFCCMTMWVIVDSLSSIIMTFLRD